MRFLAVSISVCKKEEARQRGASVTMGRCDFAGHHELDAAEEGLGHAGGAVQARVEVHQDTALSLFGRDPPTSLENARPHI